MPIKEEFAQYIKSRYDITLIEFEEEFSEEYREIIHEQYLSKNTIQKFTQHPNRRDRE